MEAETTVSAEGQTAAEAGITPAVETAGTASAAGGGGEEATGVAAGELEKVRELVLKANPDVVPDLVRGGSIDELLASVEPARGAYQRVADAVRAGVGSATPAEGAQSPAAVQPPQVPAGGANNVVDPSTLSPTTKIAQGLAQRAKP